MEDAPDYLVMPERRHAARFIAVALVSLTMLVSMCLESGLGEGDPAPDFSVKDVDGVTHELADYDGRVLVIDFFATWCVYCIDQIPTMKEVRDRYSEEDVAILWVDADDSESKEKVAAYRVKYDISWPVAYKAGSMGEDYIVDAYPTTLVIDGDGVVQYYHTGTVSGDKLKEVIDDLV
jgi:thiol-disulfide isomerase/thioredoxin